MNLQKLNPWNWFKKKSNDADHNAHMSAQQEETACSTMPNREPGKPQAARQSQRQVDPLFSIACSFFDALSPRLMPQAGWLRSESRPQAEEPGGYNQYASTLNMPRLPEDNLAIEIQNHILITSGEKDEKNLQREKPFYGIQRSYCAFKRTNNLPTDINTRVFKTNFKSGPVTLVIRTT